MSARCIRRDGDVAPDGRALRRDAGRGLRRRTRAAPAVRPPARLLGPAPMTVGARPGHAPAQRPGDVRADPLAHRRRAAQRAREIYEFGQPGPRHRADRCAAPRRRGERHRRPFRVEQRGDGCDAPRSGYRRPRLPHPCADDRPCQAARGRRAVAVVGGINWGVSSPANHDYDAELRGPVVAKPGSRVRSRPRHLRPRSRACRTRCATPRSWSPRRSPARRSARLRWADRRRRPHPRPRAVRAHRHRRSSMRSRPRRCARGRRARAARPLPAVEQPRIRSASRRRHPRCAGIAVSGELLHAKAIVADATSVLFGSANWSGGGFARNHELDIELAVAPGRCRRCSTRWTSTGPRAPDGGLDKRPLSIYRSSQEPPHGANPMNPREQATVHDEPWAGILGSGRRFHHMRHQHRSSRALRHRRGWPPFDPPICTDSWEAGSAPPFASGRRAARGDVEPRSSCCSRRSPRTAIRSSRSSRRAATAPGAPVRDPSIRPCSSSRTKGSSGPSRRMAGGASSS